MQPLGFTTRPRRDFEAYRSACQEWWIAGSKPTSLHCQGAVAAPVGEVLAGFATAVSGRSGRTGSPRGHATRSWWRRRGMSAPTRPVLPASRPLGCRWPNFGSTRRCGPRIALALQAAATALAAPAAIAPLTGGADPVSAAAAGRWRPAATLSGQLAGGISRLAQGAQAVTKALAGYVSTDAAGAARIDGHAAAAAAAETVAAIVIPSVPRH